MLDCFKNFPVIFGERKKGKLYILKKIGLSTFKDILQKYVYNSTVMFFITFLFCLKGYSETLGILYISPIKIDLSHKLS